MKKPSNKFDQSPSEEESPLDFLAKDELINLDLDTSISGWKYIYKYDRSVIRKSVYSFLIISLIIWQQDWRMLLLMVVASGFMISAELFNTCVELICDYLTNKYDQRIKIIKDVSAASTNIAFILWIGLALYEIYITLIEPLLM